MEPSSYWDRVYGHRLSPYMPLVLSVCHRGTVHKNTVLTDARIGVGSPEASVIGHCEPPYVGGRI